MRTAALKKLASRRPFIRFPDRSTIRLATPDVMEFARTSTVAAWPAKVAVVADEGPNTVALSIDKSKVSLVKDDLKITAPLRRQTSPGLVTQVLSVDDVLVPRDTTPQALVTLLRDAKRFAVARGKRSSVAKPGDVNVSDAQKKWGAKQPVIGAIQLYDGLRKRLRIRLYKTPGLAKSLVIHRGRLIIVNLHPQDILRIKKLTSWSARGLQLNVRARTAEDLIPGLHRALKVKVLPRAPADDDVRIVEIGKIRGDAKKKIHDAAAVIAKDEKKQPGAKKDKTPVAAVADESDVQIVTLAKGKPAAAKVDKAAAVVSKVSVKNVPEEKKLTGAQKRKALAAAAAAAIVANATPVATFSNADEAPTVATATPEVPDVDDGLEL